MTRMRFFPISKQRRHGGGVYIAVMGVAIIVAIISTTAMQITRLETRAGVASNEMDRAQLAAHSAIEFALGRISFYSDWRTRYEHGVEEPKDSWLSLGTMGQYKFVLLDDDGDLSDDPDDDVTIRGIGVAGNTTSVETVSLALHGEPLSCLQASFHSHGPLTVGSSDLITTDQTISTNSIMYAMISGNAWAVGTVSGTISGTIDQFQTPARAMPDEITVFDYYINNGTQIPFSDIPGGKIEKQLLSPNYNPFGGTTNAQGIYVIDCENEQVNIIDSRILGTLVLLNVGNSSALDKDIYWEPAVANYPALMVQGDIEMKWHADHTLSESQHGVNFNPVGTPYLGVDDSDTNDQYPAVIKGLIYVSGNFKVGHACNLEGALVVSGASNVNNDLTLTYDSTILDNPPPGFTDGAVMQIVPGSWQRTEY